MNYFTLFVNCHILLCIYTLFIFWKDDVFSRGATIETVINWLRPKATPLSVILSMLTLCVLPILNWPTLYRLVRAEVETIQLNLNYLRKKVIRYKGGFIVSE